MILADEQLLRSLDSEEEDDDDDIIIMDKAPNDPIIVNDEDDGGRKRIEAAATKAVFARCLIMILPVYVPGCFGGYYYILFAI